MYIGFVFSILLTRVLVYVDGLRPSQHFCSHVATSSCLPGLNKSACNCLAQFVHVWVRRVVLQGVDPENSVSGAGS